jgi:hypothetical protein
MPSNYGSGYDLHANQEYLKDKQQTTANNVFDAAVFKETQAVNRMLTDRGTVDTQSIQNLKPFGTARQWYDSLSENYPSGRGIDTQVLTEKHAAAQSVYDMNIANQINLLRQSGMSEARIDKTFAQHNPAMRQYAAERGIIQPRIKSDFGIGTGLAIGGSVYGATELARLSKAPKVGASKKAALRKFGYGYSDKKGIHKLTKANIAKGIEPDIKKPKFKKAKLQGTPVKGKDINFGRNKAVAKKFVKAENKRRKAEATKKAASKAASSVIKARNAQAPNIIGRAALNSTGKGAGKVATNIALRSIGTSLGGKAATGLLARAAGGLLGGPIGWGITAATTIPMIMNLIKNKAPATENTQVWK